MALNTGTAGSWHALSQAATNGTPYPAKTAASALKAAAALPGTAGVYTATSILDVRGARSLTLLVSYDGAAIANVASLIPLMSAEAAEPATGDDTWFGFGINDGSVTGGTLTASSLPAGTDFSVAPDFGRSLNRVLDIRTEPLDGATDDIRMRVKLDVSDAQWVQVLYAEAGVVGTPGTLGIKYVLSV